MKRLVAIQPLSGYRLHVRFDDGVEGDADLSRLVGHGVFAAWGDPAQFSRVSINRDGAPEWPGEIDLCPDQLYLEVTGKPVKELFPDWQTEPPHA